MANPALVATADAPIPAWQFFPLRGATTVLKALASLRLTVVLFLLSVLLVFAGTLAQVDNGVWTVVNQYFRSAFVWIPFQVFVHFGKVFFGFLGFPANLKVPGGFPYPGGWLLGTALLVNLLAAHLVRFKLSLKRSGILLIHAGLILMMLGELVTGLFAIEGNMTIEEGKSSNYVEHRENIELAVIDPSDPKNDDVVVVPGSRLRGTEEISHDDLPFDLVVDDYMVNSAQPRPVKDGTKNPATAGDGLQYVAEPRPEVSGTAMEQKVDLASAYVTVKDKKTHQALGTYLVSLWFSAISDRPQRVTVDGKTYELWLRFKRTYKPYTLTLEKFTHDVYIGTDKAKDFRSTLRLVNPQRHDDRQVEIYMNNPLRYAGETFFQSGFIPSQVEGGKDKGTILQVVTNPGWLLPYFSCFVVALGMMIHFGMHLIGFLSRQRRVAV